MNAATRSSYSGARASRLSIGPSDDVSPYNRFSPTFRFSPKNNNNNNNTPKASTVTADVMDGVPISLLRQLASQNAQEHQASFYAHLVYAKTQDPLDALVLAEAQLQSQKHASCLRIIEESNLLQSAVQWQALLLACAALAAIEEWTLLVQVVEDSCRLQGEIVEDDDNAGWQTLQQSIPTSTTAACIHPLARILYWKGRAQYELGDGVRAAKDWKRSITVDPLCQISWEALLSHHLVTPHEAHAVIQSIDFQQHKWLKLLYTARIEVTPQEIPASVPVPIDDFALDASSIYATSPLPHVATPNLSLSTTIDTGTRMAMPAGTKGSIPEDVDHALDQLWNTYRLQNSPHVLALAARRAYRRFEWHKALEYCQQLDRIDPAFPEAAYCYIATLTRLGHTQTLFRVAHEWVEACPKSAASWFAVGAYYYACGRHHVAQRHFCRATRLDPQCTEAWIAFGCSFAACDESDQALASFRAAQRLGAGEHSSLLYMGMEYVRTNHLVLANYFLQAAWKASGGDPLCLHELGVLELQKGAFQASIGWFRRALTTLVGVDSLEDAIEVIHDPFWEPTLFNLGHAYRKTRQWEKAEMCFKRCISLRPESASPYAALAFTQHLQQNVDGAIDLYHQALGCKPDDPFCTEMLQRALKEALDLPWDDLENITHEPHQASVTTRSMPSPWSIKDDSMMSEDMESDVDMSAAS